MLTRNTPQEETIPRKRSYFSKINRKSQALKSIINISLTNPRSKIVGMSTSPGYESEGSTNDSNWNDVASDKSSVVEDSSWTMDKDKDGSPVTVNPDDITLLTPALAVIHSRPDSDVKTVSATLFPNLENKNFAEQVYDSLPWLLFGSCLMVLLFKEVFTPPEPMGMIIEEVYNEEAAVRVGKKVALVMSTTVAHVQKITSERAMAVIMLAHTINAVCTEKIKVALATLITMSASAREALVANSINTWGNVKNIVSLFARDVGIKTAKLPAHISHASDIVGDRLVDIKFVAQTNAHKVGSALKKSINRAVIRGVMQA
jgi:hypothetical protein